ncbi:MAG: DUF1882 domain-containing protein [Moorea sp. SIO3C2]|nr:DUF1882 domain-containing protein [Moorena sp. SIO3C2]
MKKKPTISINCIKIRKCHYQNRHFYEKFIKIYEKFTELVLSKN